MPLLPPLRVLALLPLALLAGCGGGGGGGANSGGGDVGAQAIPPASPPKSLRTTSDPFVTAGAAALSSGAGFDEAAAAAVRAEPEFAAQQVNAIIGGRHYSTFSYRDVRGEYPLSVGLTGAGETIAVVDDGFRLTHQELAGKAIRTVGAPATESHGTAVAAIAAGRRDGAGMTGLAPGAALHVSSFRAGFSGLATATQDAIATSDAVVQNNSWGFVDGGKDPIPVTEVETYLAANPGASVAAALQASLGGAQADIQAYLDALHAFTARGVVVFAAPNKNDVTSLSVMDGLPVVAPALLQGWLVAVSAVPTVRDGAIVSADRLSAGCLQLAHSCLTATGVVTSANASSDTSYQLWNGTSFAAPQISAGVALLAEAFPALPASDLRRRLLASADNGFFAHTGATDFGNGVVHGFNEEFGHGFLNLKAALLPIGAVGLPATASAYGGVVALGSETLSSAGPQGDALVGALAAERVAVFDALGADFTTSALALYGGRAGADQAERLRLFARAAEAQGTVASFGFTTGAGEAERGWRLHAGPTEEVLGRLGLAAATSPVVASAGSLAGLAAGATSLAVTTAIGGGASLSFYGFSNGRPEEDARDPLAFRSEPGRAEPIASGAGFAWSRGLPGGASLSMGGVVLGEAGAALGMTGSGRLGGMASASGALDLGLAAPLASDRLRLQLNAQVGAGSGAGGAGLAVETRGAWFSAFGLRLEIDSLAREGDRLTLFARQPLRMEAGRLALDLPSGRTPEGAVLWRTLELDLAPSARQIDIGFSYFARLGESNRLRVAAAYAHHEGHAKGARGVSAMGAFERRF